MRKLYQKSGIWFAVIWIVVYVMGTSVADGISSAIGVEKLITLILHLALSAAALVWLKNEKLFEEYGLCKSHVKASRFLYYIPLVFIATCNFWFGVRMNLPLHETIFYVGSMVCVGFLEELIFRGFLFKAMSRDNLKAAVIVSSVTFGIGHIVNLVNGSGANLLSNLCQVVYAIAFGFLFVIIFYRGKSLLACIITHSVINALSVFANESNLTAGKEIFIAVLLAVTAIVYSVVLLKILPTADSTAE